MEHKSSYEPAMVTRIYTDQDLLPHGVRHDVILYPFWGRPPTAPGEPRRGRYDEFVREAPTYLSLSDIGQADMTVLPAAWQHMKQTRSGRQKARYLSEEARRHGLRTCIFFWSDSDEPVPFHDAIVYRTSLYKSKRTADEHAMPVWNEDFGQYSEDGAGPWDDGPIVTFCGQSDPAHSRPSWLRRISTKARRAVHQRRLSQFESQWVDWRNLRSEALDLLEINPDIAVNAIRLNEYFGGATAHGSSVEQRRWARKRYVDNMKSGQYVLCARGVGNYSFRFYEALSLGRIPVLIDTDCVLPFEDEIPYDDLIVKVRRDELHLVADRVMAHYDGRSNAELRAQGMACRRYWLEWLSPQGFYKQWARRHGRSDG